MQNGLFKRERPKILDLKVRRKIRNLINQGALFIINHSGGKDSQAMTALLTQIVPKEQIYFIHAHLPEVEWSGTMEHIEATIGDLPLAIVQAGKTFFEMIFHRKKWPSPQYRQCTSDLKRGPIEKGIRHELKRRGLLLAVNCMGMRAEESSNRAKLETFKLNKQNSRAGRQWYDWLPIHDLLEDEVFQVIKEAGQEAHWAYKEGMSRLSCCFCIMASTSDLKTATRLNPDLYERYVKAERKIDQTIMMPSETHGRRFLPEIVFA